jgi:GNAT superfamily N-acetyltransferase
MQRQETIRYLEMTSRAELRPARRALVAYEIRRAEIPCPELSRFFYTAVGGDWLWVDRLPWKYEQWLEWVSRPGYEMWIASVKGTPAGYFELDATVDGEVELAFFGLLPQFMGLHLGGSLLTDAIERAWRTGVNRIWLHTCSFDHPGAVNNYLSRGFRLVRTEHHPKEMPNEGIGPWPGAAKTRTLDARAAALVPR